jgi:acyl-CoA synthetase (AMP-forming)/AMP-acid ligase II
MADLPNLNFAARLAQRLGDCSYLIDAAAGQTIAPADVRRLISSFGAHLLSLGLRPGDRIIISCAVSPASSIAYLGSMYTGLVPVLVADSVLPSSLRGLIQHSGARAVWTEGPTEFRSVEDVEFLALCGFPGETREDLAAPAACRASDVAALVCTSGSTGAPRLVMVSHENLTANTEAIIRSQHLGREERAMLILPLSYCFGASVLHSHLYQGGGVVFDRRFMFPDKVLHAIKQYECTTFAGVPTVYNILLRRSNIHSIPMPSLRRLLQAGGALAPGRINEMRNAVPGAQVYVMYGQTEATARISCLDPSHLKTKLGSAGRPLDNLTVRIVNEEGTELPPGKIGEVIVRGPSVALGYLNDPEENQRVFRDGWLWTGDLGSLDNDGYLWIHGRRSAFLKMRGVRVSFAEVESRVAGVPGVWECAAAAVPHPEAGEALALYIVPDREAVGVAERVRRSLPTTWDCESINVVAQIPKTPNGKVYRELLPAMAIAAHV